jgi:hypothetical protein
MKEKITVGRNFYAEVFGAQDPSFWINEVNRHFTLRDEIGVFNPL